MEVTAQEVAEWRVKEIRFTGTLRQTAAIKYMKANVGEQFVISSSAHIFTRRVMGGSCRFKKTGLTSSRFTALGSALCKSIHTLHLINTD
ncbi:hypothetical protein [Paenibacillus sp. S150]|uniref:DUF6953 family protein n=1 Tax=Paenibacillus sp. S150 TaxID=2749826 RepID=UPI0035CAFDAC